jgi:steroid delta-isomerase-like uncharacterized protein
MGASENRAALLRSVVAFNNTRDRSAYFDLYASDAVIPDLPGGLPPNLDGFRRYYAELWSAFPDMHLTVEDIAAERDTVAGRFVVTGTHLGPFKGIFPTGKAVRFEGMTMLHFRDGKCVGRWGIFGIAGVLAQLQTPQGTGQKPSQKPSLSDVNKQIVYEYTLAVQRHRDFDAIERTVSPDFYNYAVLPGLPRNREGSKQLFHMLWRVFPDMDVAIHDQVSEGGLVATRKTITGTHSAEFLGVPATGKRIALEVIDILAVRDGRITAHWAQADIRGLYRQMGVEPPG